MKHLTKSGRGHESQGTRGTNPFFKLPAPRYAERVGRIYSVIASAATCLVLLALCPTGVVRAGEAVGAGPAKLALPLNRGICIDRQVHSIPPTPDRITQADDVHLVRTMGFEFVKLIFNPVVFKSGDGLETSHMAYFDQIVNYGAAEKLPVVVCIHPEWKYKEQVLGNPAEFASFLSFMKALSAHISARWTCEQVALQLMTEPPPTSTNRSDWNYWGTLQRRLHFP